MKNYIIIYKNIIDATKNAFLILIKEIMKKKMMMNKIKMNKIKMMKILIWDI